MIPFLTAIITIPSASTTELTAYVGTLAGDLWPLIALAIGVPLAFYVIGKVISMVRGRTK